MLMNKTQANNHLTSYPDHRLYPVGYIRSVDDMDRERVVTSFEVIEKRWKSLDHEGKVKEASNIFARLGL